MRGIDRRDFLWGTVVAAGLAPSPSHSDPFTDWSTDFVVATRFAAAGIPCRAFSVSSTGMMPTIAKGDVVLADLRAGGRLPARGDVVAVKRSKGVVYLKRVIALPGDRVRFENWLPVVNGNVAQWSALDPITRETEKGPVTCFVFEERIADAPAARVAKLRVCDDELFANIPEITVAPDEIYVLGDNRCNSFDSRLPDYGTTRVGDIFGRVVYRFRPDAGWLVPKESVPGYPH